MPKVSDAELRFHAKSDGPQPLQDMARELLAARAVVEAATLSLMNAALVCDEDCLLADAIRKYSEVTR